MFGDFIKSVGSVFTAPLDIIGDVINPISGSFTNVVETMTTIPMGVVDTVNNGVNNVGNVLNTGLNTIGNLGNNISDVFNSPGLLLVGGAVILIMLLK